MDLTGNGPAPTTGKVRRAFAALGAWLRVLEYTGTDYVLDRIQILEGEIAALKRRLPAEGSSAPPDGQPH